MTRALVDCECTGDLLRPSPTVHKSLASFLFLYIIYLYQPSDVLCHSWLLSTMPPRPGDNVDIGPHPSQHYTS